MLNNDLDANSSAINELNITVSNIKGRIFVLEHWGAQVTFAEGRDTGWSISVTKSGYTAIACSPVMVGNSAGINLGYEGLTMGNGTFAISGFGRPIYGGWTVIPRVFVTWMQNI